MRRLTTLLPLLACALLAACASPTERWAVLRFERLSYQNLFEQTADTIGGSGYRLLKLDASKGSMESDWQYGTSVREIRGPSRRKVFATIGAADEAGVYEVRIRVEEQVIRRGGILARQVRESEDWEDWKDAYDEAEYLVARLGALLQDYRVRVTVEDVEAPMP